MSTDVTLEGCAASCRDRERGGGTRAGSPPLYTRLATAWSSGRPPRDATAVGTRVHRCASMGRRPQEGSMAGSRLAGKVAIVTGAGSRAEGIGNGRASAVLFAREGAKVLLVDQH